MSTKSLKLLSKALILPFFWGGMWGEDNQMGLLLTYEYIIVLK